MSDDEPWEIAFGYIGQEPKTFRCTEDEVDDLTRQIHFSFGATSNWNIRAYRVDGADNGQARAEVTIEEVASPELHHHPRGWFARWRHTLTKWIDG